MAATSSHTPVLEDSHGYWLRCGVAIQECLKGACLGILLHPGVCGLPDDEQKLYAVMIVFKRNESKNLKIIQQYQWNILCHVCDQKCPAPCPKMYRTSIDELDITLICILIKNMKKIVVGFNLSLVKQFLPYIEDARITRNEMMHSDPAKILKTNKQYNDLWLKIEKILKGLKFRDMNRFHSLKTSPLDPYTAQKIDWLNSSYQELRSDCNKTEMKRLEALVTEMNESIKDLRSSKFDKTEMTRLEAMVNENNQELTTDITRLEAMVNENSQKLIKLEAKVEDVQQNELKATSEELKKKMLKQYSRMKVAFNPKATSLANNDIINRDEIIVDLSLVSRTLSVFDTACDNQDIEQLREQQKKIASDTASTTSYSEIVTSKDDYVIISGIPGSGKTTLVETILHKWALGEMWHKFDYAFIIYLRDLVRFKNRDDITANEMISYHYPGYDIMEIANSGKAILILEGFDELYGKTDLRSKEEEYSCYTQSIHDLFDPKNQSLPFTRLVTSRPGSCPILFETVLFDNTTEKLFTVTGFSDKSIYRYVRNHFREKDAADVDDVINNLKKVPVVYDLMVVPFNCWGVCYLIKNKIPVEDFGQTETSLYANLLMLFIRKHGFRNSKIKLKEVHAEPKFKEICKGLAALAYKLSKTNKINFSEEDLPVGVSMQTLIKDSGMIIEIDGEIDTSYQFLHYTFHEFLVALHLMGIGENIIRIFDDHDYQVTAMLAGLLGGLAVESQSNTTLKQISKLFDTPETRSVSIEKVISNVGKPSEMLRLIYEFHNPITSDINILFRNDKDLPVRTHVEYFKKLCADQKIHLYTDQLGLVLNNTNYEIISSLISCCKCEKLELDIETDTTLFPRHLITDSQKNIILDILKYRLTKSIRFGCFYLNEQVNISYFKNLKKFCADENVDVQIDYLNITSIESPSNIASTVADMIVQTNEEESRKFIEENHFGMIILRELPELTESLLSACLQSTDVLFIDILDFQRFEEMINIFTALQQSNLNSTCIKLFMRTSLSKKTCDEYCKQFSEYSTKDLMSACDIVENVYVFFRYDNKNKSKEVDQVFRDSRFKVLKRFYFT